MSTTPLGYQRILLPEAPVPADTVSLFSDYAAMLVSVMSLLADRYERHPDYPFIDMKFNLTTGEDFAPDDALRGPGSIYGWIQGRALEALVDHVLWLKNHPEIEEKARLIPRLEAIMREVLQTLRRMRAQNDGHVFFTMHPDGRPFVLNEKNERVPIERWDPDVYTFSDAFSAKGMYAAARYLGEDAIAQEALAYCHAVDDAIWNERFAVEEKAVDPLTGPRPETGIRHEAPFMIHLGMAAVMATLNDDPTWLDIGLRTIDHLLEYHVHTGRSPFDLEEYDYWEFANLDGSPLVQDGTILSSPGHAVEFVGLGLKFTQALKRHPARTAEHVRRTSQVESSMPSVLERNFQNGFHPQAGGLYQFVNLITRRPTNPYLPWWTMPESIRAAALAYAAAQTEADRKTAMNVLRLSHNAFATHWVRQELHLTAYQMRSDEGIPIPVIPATPDADPGYHTGASIIDFLNVMEELTKTRL